ncbi:hypothetical protein BARRETLEMON_26 [Arthrobacter phage BarretLemon]|uniref:Uncharacterized protein n=4 Tax=Marthavirus barretlemon TaxID=2560300 RepID=A0A386KQJ4_9CAUD|nr:hypothetical protein BJD79_gp26 [Arthrobacter phage BarretLemon]AMM44488.1 hypothetical protein BARRETLEMON_26 [Arthrobacter phage BarretLemon]ASR78056.1 hypothetical protein SEA_TIMINATOR_26 [Arthrobacter phage Timinator]AYD86497.1 hypothetical protein SEA_LEEROYJ_26 [Arthrobacter phage LeeroyJ]QJD53356.1 hypothetical protein SEA_STEVIEBAY_26 [Arthrobacter phage StevieBAY]
MNALLSKLFGWHKYIVTDEEKSESAEAVKQAEHVKKAVESLAVESAAVGARQRFIREENNWTRSLEHTFKGAL